MPTIVSMAAPVLGGLLVADEVIDLLLPVIFNWYQLRKWRKLHMTISQSRTNGDLLPVGVAAAV